MNGDGPRLETGRIVIVRWIDQDGHTRITLDQQGDTEDVATAVAMLALAQDRILHPRKETHP